MRRLVVTAAIVGLSTALLAAPAVAAECPKLITQIQNAASNRLDNTGYQARQKAVEAQKLHSEGKHAESVKAAREGLTLLGIK
jgi:hypothetical protein